MKVLIDARFYGLENAGIGRYVINLVDQLQEIDQKTSYTIFLKEKYFKTLKLPGNWTKVRVDIPHYSLAEQLLLPKVLSSEKFDLVHFPHFNLPLAFSGPFVLTIHDLIKHTSRGRQTTTRAPFLYWPKYVGYKVVFSNAVRRAKKVFVPSRWVKQELGKNYPDVLGKLVVTYEGVDEVFEKRAENRKKTAILKKYKIKKPYVVYAGSAYPHKNLERLVEATKTLEGRVDLVLASSRNVFLKRLESYLKQTGAKNTAVLGFVPDEDLAVLYQEAQAFVFPTLSEGFGLPGLEAMATGTPVICSDIPVLREVYADAALYFNPEDAQDIVRKIEEVLGFNEKTRQDIIAKGQKRAKSFSWRKMAKQTLKTYEEVLSP